jgi:hypothetical protein
VRARQRAAVLSALSSSGLCSVAAGLLARPGGDPLSHP